MKTRIMIVEDEVIVAESLSLTLRELGYAVIDHALSGKEAIRKAGEQKPDLILMDVVLQNGMDGIEAASSIREHFHIPVIYLTAYADDANIQRAQQTEPLGYIVKPFEPEDVHAAIEICLHKHRVEQKLKEDLETQVGERTRQLQNVVHELESFTYSISHDLRAPLRAINSFASVIFEEQKNCFDSEGERHLGIIIENATLMSTLLDELLAFSRLSLQTMTVGTVDMTELVRSVSDELRRNEPRDRKLEVTIHDLPPAMGSKLLLRQVIINLLGNAFKFTRRRDIAKVEIGFTAQDREYVYYVRDNGVGFDPRYAEKAFDVFRRLHPDGEFEGSGVGLAIVKRIIARHGGRVWAEGEADKGATFYFSLPVTD